jgi:hypothetical protein
MPLPPLLSPRLRVLRLSYTGPCAIAVGLQAEGTALSRLHGNPAPLGRLYPHQSHGIMEAMPQIDC